ncbi:hypothetical protein [Lacticaseibacillus sharpeae]|uniref:Uncharacterized protein n=1 Tax=Lacticaseibacillus sharpeae JCM 1186 = DSM 20505 TaxID=1291052 RepID=A0A0R1ZMJ3_9LACO|nr:hypothetical protein [Lacticaseibacillus sharpeae]KRM56225.1 hypothetical protein FC18_GL000202 [Lacticaseibacillus sharpeae JCM 1186 = DSM 20505]
MIVNEQEQQQLALITANLKTARQFTYTLMDSIGELENALSEDSMPATTASSLTLREEHPKMTAAVINAANIMDNLLELLNTITEAVYLDKKHGSHLAGIETDSAGKLELVTTFREGTTGVNPDSVAGLSIVDDAPHSKATESPASPNNQDAVLDLTEQGSNIMHMLMVALDELSTFNPPASVAELTNNQLTDLGRKTAVHFTGMNLLLLHVLDMLAQQQEKTRDMLATGKEAQHAKD